MKRLDQMMVERGLVQSRSQAQRLIKLGKVSVDGRTAKNSHMSTSRHVAIEIRGGEKYVSRAGFKLASVVEKLSLDFKNKAVLDVGSSTGGFTDYALQHGARKVIAVDVGTDQLHPSLRGDKRIELHEKTDIRDFKTDRQIDIILIDVSFISVNEVLSSVQDFYSSKTEVVAMVKPQFEAGEKQKNKGVVKNDTIRRKILKSFEQRVKQDWLIEAKADSEVEGSKGNLERFYRLRKIL